VQRLIEAPFPASADGAWSGLAGFLALAGLVAAFLLGRWSARRRLRSSLRDLTGSLRELAPGDPELAPDGEGVDPALDELQRELEAALQRLDEVIKVQAHFASNVAHELKAPIAALLADVQVSRGSLTDPDEARAFLARAEDELQHPG
jgi:signal transduction histidine kinase